MTIELLDLKKDDLKASQEKIERDMKQIIAHIELTARLRWLSYEAHRKAGFSRTEALILCQKMTL